MPAKSYTDIGCWNIFPDSNNNEEDAAVPKITDDISSNPIQKCYEAAISNGYDYFGISSGGTKCRISQSAGHTFAKYGQPTNCGSNGYGTQAKVHMYKINRKCKCYQISSIIIIRLYLGMTSNIYH